MPFKKIQEAMALAAGIDSAMNRQGDMGMELLRSTLPDLRELIDEVNAALQEVDELLFRGLRDEAVALNEPEFPQVVARLNLEDKANWPHVRSFLEREGIPHPPQIDFETLTALESAYAELEPLTKPLDRLRRLVLARAPLVDRLSVLRKIRDYDTTKPVWSDAVADHERARIAELQQAVPRAIAARDPAEIAALHAEIVDPDWIVPVPGNLVEATRGADVWGRLREALHVADGAAAILERGLSLAGEYADADAVGTLRQGRQQWNAAAAAARECLSALAGCPKVMELVAAEGLPERLAALGLRVQAALAWIQTYDDKEALLAWQAQTLSQLDAYLAELPASPVGEATWLVGVDRLVADLAARGMLSEDIRGRADHAVMLVRRRPAQRRFLRFGITVGIVALVFGMIMWLVTG